MIGPLWVIMQKGEIKEIVYDCADIAKYVSEHYNKAWDYEVNASYWVYDMTAKKYNLKSRVSFYRSAFPNDWGEEVEYL